MVSQFPGQESNPRSLQWELRVLITELPGRSQIFVSLQCQRVASALSMNVKMSLLTSMYLDEIRKGRAGPFHFPFF